MSGSGSPAGGTSRQPSRESLPGGADPTAQQRPAGHAWAGNTMFRTFDRGTIDSRTHHIAGGGVFVQEALPERLTTPDPSLAPQPHRTLPTKFTRDCQAAAGLKEFVNSSRLYTPGAGYNAPQRPAWQ